MWFRHCVITGTFIRSVQILSIQQPGLVCFNSVQSWACYCKRIAARPFFQVSVLGTRVDWRGNRKTSHHYLFWFPFYSRDTGSKADCVECLLVGNISLLGHLLGSYSASWKMCTDIWDMFLRFEFKWNKWSIFCNLINAWLPWILASLN